MMFAVFVGFYLWSDHAPWWIWVLAGIGFLVDEARARNEFLAHERWALLQRMKP